jgi:exodeoxyribonuclease VII small subunit
MAVCSGYGRAKYKPGRLWWQHPARRGGQELQGNEVFLIKIVQYQCLWVKCAPYAKMKHMGIEMAAKTGKTQSFEAALAELEQVVADMESGKLTLEDSLAAYKRGAELLSFCRSRLDDAQQQVRVLEEGTLKDFTASPDAN